MAGKVQAPPAWRKGFSRREKIGREKPERNSYAGKEKVFVFPLRGVFIATNDAFS
jgi:hypothetical protein